jgi:hypothetical protein
VRVTPTRTGKSRLADACGLLNYLEKHMSQIINDLPPKLSSIAGDRDWITTGEFASTFSISSQTVRKNFCLTGECYGIKPTKIGGKLLWSVEKVAMRLRGDL